VSVSDILPVDIAGMKQFVKFCWGLSKRYATRRARKAGLNRRFLRHIP
jgi:hypothetical protein